MKMYLKKIVFPLCAMSLFSCTNDSTSDLTETIPIEDDVTYLKNVKSIIDNNCNSCHGSVPINGAPMSLVTYAEVKEAMLERDLVGRIVLNEGQSGQMPYGGPKMPQNLIDIIIQWETDGLQE